MWVQLPPCPPMKKVKGFQEQYSACAKAGLHGKGRLEKFKDFPEMLPLPFSRAGRAIAEKLKQDPECGLEVINCLKFGGDCRSDNPACRKHRGLPPTERTNMSQQEYITMCDSRDKYATRASKVERGLSDSSNRDSSDGH